MAVSSQTKLQTVEDRKLARIPLYGNTFTRDGTLAKDQRYINCFPETTKNIITDLKKFFLVKRPGTVLDSEIVAGEARGLFYWNSHTYSIIDDTLYEDGISIFTLATSTGPCGFLTALNPTEVLFFCDGIDGYIINKDSTIENIEKAHLRWAETTVVELGDKRIPTTNNGYYYTVSVAGTTTATEPTWPTVIDDTVIDGDVTWVCTAVYTGATKWQASTAIEVDDLVTPITESSLYYKVTVSDGTTGSSEPTWPTVIGETVTAGGITYECMGYYGGFPSPHIPTPVSLDGYLCLAEKDSIDMYNSATINLFSWNPLDYISAESFSDPIKALARQNNYIVAFGETNTEMFYDAAVETGSPFLRNESFMLQVGILAPNAIMQTEKLCMWVGKSDAGKSAVWMLDGFSPKEISTEYLEKVLENETDWDNIYGFGLRVAGHFFFVLNLPTEDVTFVYDMEENMWHEWQYNGGVFPFNRFTNDGTGKILLLHNTLGNLYELNKTIYSDYDADMTVTIITTKYDFDNNKRKFLHKTEVIGDLVSSDISLYWSDDDYTTWSNEKVLSLSERPYFMRCGLARRRAFKLVHTANTHLRLEFLEVIYTQGNT